MFVSIRCTYPSCDLLQIGNPSFDEQAQDRAFRIGQNKDVDVLRLVARGTIEELKYCRQVYKVHLNQKTLGVNDDDKVQPARLFRGVAHDSNRKGELFGMENLLNFKDGSFMDDLWTSSKNVNKTQEYDVSALADLMSGNEGMLKNVVVDEDQEIAETLEIETSTCGKQFNHDDFLRSDRGGALTDDIETLFGESQIHHEAYEKACEENPTLSEDKTERTINDEKSAVVVGATDEFPIHQTENSRGIQDDSNIINTKQLKQDTSDIIEEDNISKNISPGLASYRKPTSTKSLIMDNMLLPKQNYKYRSSSILYRPNYLDETKRNTK